METRTIKNQLVSFSAVLAKALLIAISFSWFIYAEHFGLTSKLLNTILIWAAFYGLLTQPRSVVLLSGFLIGLFWFHWIGLCFRYYNTRWMIPIAPLIFASIYTLYFGVVALFQNVWYRAAALFVLSYFYPFDFTWLQLELPMVESYFGIEKWQFAILLVSIALFVSLKYFRCLAAFLLLIPALNFSSPQKLESPLSIKLVDTSIAQNVKWNPTLQKQIVELNIEEIRHAIDEGYRLVVLPETTLPLNVNEDSDLLERLSKLSEKIAILAGGMYREHNESYNVSYIFDKKHMLVAKKMILVPFGEYTPLPTFIKRWVNETLFHGAEDLQAADAPTDFTIDGVHFRNAICYEATSPKIYENAPTFLIAISNNAWFHPSIEPTLQKLLIRFHARKNHTVVYHASNMGGTGIIY